MGMDEMDGGTQGTMEEFGWIEPQNISNGAEPAAKAEPAAEPELRKQEAVVEAVLFTMGQSVEIGQLAAALQCGNDAAEAAAERLKKQYEERQSGMQIVRFEDSYQMCTRADYYTNLIRVAAAPRRQVLTDVMMETLAIIAYRQPVTKSDIEKIRGVNADHAVNRLVEYGLVCEVGRLDAPGRPVLFATTEEFLRRFGVGSTEELPVMNPDQREEIRSEVEEELNVRLDADGKPLEEAEAGEPETSENVEGPAEEAARGGAEPERLGAAGEPETSENVGEPGKEAAGKEEAREEEQA